MASNTTEIGEWLRDNCDDLVAAIPNDLSKELAGAPHDMITIAALVCYIHKLEEDNESE